MVTFSNHKQLKSVLASHKEINFIIYFYFNNFYLQGLINKVLTAKVN